MTIIVLATAAIVLYLGAAILLAAPITGCPHPFRRSGMAAASLAIAAHFAVLLIVHGGRLDLHFFGALSLVAAVIAALTVLVNVWRAASGLGVIVMPLAAVLLAVDLFLAPPTAPKPLAWPISLHVAVALLAYSLLSIGALLAILLAWQERSLRSHNPARLIRALPPLTQTEGLLFQIITAGFALLTLTLLSGAVFVHDVRGQHLAHIIVFSVLAWLIFAALLWGRWRHGWRGARAVNMTLLGMAMLALGFFGSKFVLELILQRHG